MRKAFCFKGILACGFSGIKAEKTKECCSMAPLPRERGAIVLIFFFELLKKCRWNYYHSSPLPQGGFRSNTSNLRLGAVTFLQRFGKALNPHFHFHSCIIDGLFDEDGAFYPASFSKEGVQSVQEKIRTRVLRLFQRRGLLEGDWSVRYDGMGAQRFFSSCGCAHWSKWSKGVREAP